jgi:DNA adenine methylase
MAKPFLKWAGGKRQLLNKFDGLYPRELYQGKIKNYYEPFLGCGAVFFHIATRVKLERAYLCDINEELILTFKVVQKDVHGLIEFMERYKKEYLSLNKIKRKEYYYDMRRVYNLERFKIDFNKYSKDWIPRAAQMIFLNKTCYNGLFRVNSSGRFNSPAGTYGSPKIYDEQNLADAAEMLRIAEIRRADFAAIAKRINRDSFIYFDPPYRPISSTSYFTAYSPYAFGDDKQRELAFVFRKLDKKGVKIMLSNSDPKNNNPTDCFFEGLYRGYNIIRVPAVRTINSKTSQRGSIKEIIITNY